jgi:hypothetical protein
LLDRSARKSNCWMSWTMGLDDGAGLVRYADSAANLRVFLLTGCTSSSHAHAMLKHGRPNTSARTRRNPPRPDCSGACTAGILAQPFGRPLLLFCFHTNSPKFVCAWSVALHTHAPAETNRAGHWQNTSAHTRERAGSIPLGPPDPITPPPSPSAATLSGPAYHCRRSCAARQTRAALLLL